MRCAMFIILPIGGTLSLFLDRVIYGAGAKKHDLVLLHLGCNLTRKVG